MFEGSVLFNQIISFIPWYEFDKCVKKYNGNYRARSFKCADHFLSILFAQLTYRESLRDIETCLNSQKNKLYHMGFRCGVISKSTISDANEIRDYRIYEEFALILMNKARKLYKDEQIIEDNNFNFNKSIYALDSSIIKVALSLMPWAEYMNNPKNKYYYNTGAIKLHTLMDLKGNIPTVNIVTNGRVYDGAILDYLIYEPGSIYIMDRGYLDYDRLYNIEVHKAYFITRHHNFSAKLKRIYSNKININKQYMIDEKNKNIKGQVICDQIVRCKREAVLKDYPDKIRRIKYKDIENNRVLVFLTNNFALEPLYITELYKKRWEIELFFKWIKQHLKIKKFYSYSMNGVKAQIWIATCAYLLVAIIKKELKLNDYSLNTILQILSLNIFTKTPINRLFEEKNYTNIEEQTPDLFSYAES